MNQKRTTGYGWLKMKSQRQSLQNNKKSHINNSPSKIQRFTPTKNQGKSHKIFSNLSRSPSNSFKQSQTKVQSNPYGSTSVINQNDDYQIKTSNKIQLNINIAPNRFSQTKNNRIRGQNPTQIPYLQEIKKRQQDFKFQNDLLQIIKPIQKKPINGDIIKSLQQQFQQFKKWIYQQLKKQQQMVIEIANKITCVLQDQQERIKKNIQKRNNNSYKPVFTGQQINLHQQILRVNNFLSQGNLSDYYQINEKDKIYSNLNALKTSNQQLQSQVNNQKSNYRHKSMSHFHFNYERTGPRFIQSSQKSNIQFNRFFDTMNKIKHQINELKLLTQKQEESMTQESRRTLIKKKN